MSTSQIIADRFEISDLEKDLLGRGGRKRASLSNCLARWR